MIRLTSMFAILSWMTVLIGASIAGSGAVLIVVVAGTDWFIVGSAVVWFVGCLYLTFMLWSFIALAAMVAEHVSIRPIEREVVRW